MPLSQQYKVSAMTDEQKKQIEVSMPLLQQYKESMKGESIRFGPKKSQCRSRSNTKNRLGVRKLFMDVGLNAALAAIQGIKLGKERGFSGIMSQCRSRSKKNTNTKREPRKNIILCIRIKKSTCQRT